MNSCCFFEVSGRSLDLMHSCLCLGLEGGPQFLVPEGRGILAVCCVFLIDSLLCRGDISRPFEFLLAPCNTSLSAAACLRR